MHFGSGGGTFDTKVEDEVSDPPGWADGLHRRYIGEVKEQTTWKGKVMAEAPNIPAAAAAAFILASGVRSQ